MMPPSMATSWFSPGDTFSSNPVFPSPTILHNQGQPFIRPPRPEFLPPPSNLLGQSRLTFEQHMARERTLWLLDERHKRQMASQGMRARVKRRSAMQISPTSTINKETLALREKENKTNGRKRSRPNNSQPITVIDLTDVEGDDEENDVIAIGVDNVSSTTSNGDSENASKKPSDEEENKNENNKSKDDSEVKDKPSKNDKTDNENELHSTVSSDQTETHVYYDEIFLEDDNGFLGDAAEEEDEATNQQILDLSVKKDEATSTGTDINPLDLTNELSEG